MENLTIGILGQPRTGTHLLAALLNANGVGMAGEVFKIHENPVLLELYTVDQLKDHFRTILNAKRVRGNVSVQMHRRHVNMLMKRLNLPTDQVGMTLFLDYIFPEGSKFITTYRIDQVSQAISWIVSDHTGIHHHNQPSPPVNSRIPYHEETILRILKQVKRDEGWEDIKRIIPIYAIAYEDLAKGAASREEVLRSLGEFLGLPMDTFDQEQFFKVSDHCKMHQEDEFLQNRMDRFFAACDCDPQTRNRLVERLRASFKFQ